MGLHYWLNEAFGEDASELRESTSWAGRAVLEHGRFILKLHANDLLREYPEVPEIPEKYVFRVTYRSRIYDNFRSEGVYLLDGARLELRIQLETHRNPPVKIQVIEVSGPNIECVRAIYRQMRSGDLKPAENWTAGARVA